jgi:hypothetical protein
MVGFAAPPVFIGLNPAYPVGNHPVGGEGQGEGAAVYIHQFMYRNPPGDFLHVSLGKNNEKFVQKHKKSIMKDPPARKADKNLYERIGKIGIFFTIYNFFRYYRLTENLSR